MGQRSFPSPRILGPKKLKPPGALLEGAVQKEENRLPSSYTLSKYSMSEIYTVHHILAHKVVKGETLYHVAWKNYSIDEATWEPIENFITLGAIHDYWTKVNDPTFIAMIKAEKADAKAKRDADKQATAERVAKKKELAMARAHLKQVKRDFNKAIDDTNRDAHETFHVAELATYASLYAKQRPSSHELRTFINAITTRAKELADKRAKLMATYPQHRAKIAAAKEALQRLDQWTCPNDDMVYPWTYQGQVHYRNYNGQVWKKNADGMVGDWCGIYVPATNQIDASAPEPNFDE